jgi:hypothetical protein
MGDVLYDDFKKYSVNHGLLDKGCAETFFMIKCKKGEFKKTLNEFKAFYKSNILKDIDFDKPSYNERYTDYEDVQFFEFTLEGIPCYLELYVANEDYAKRSEMLNYVFRTGAFIPTVENMKKNRSF